MSRTKLWAEVTHFDPREIVVENCDPAKYVRALLPEEVFLRDYLLDKKVLDTEDREVEVVYDIRLVLSNHNMYVSDVDISRYGLLRQIGLKRLASHFYKRADEAKKKMIPWSYVQLLPPGLAFWQPLQLLTTCRIFRRLIEKFAGTLISNRSKWPSG